MADSVQASACFSAMVRKLCCISINVSTLRRKRSVTAPAGAGTLSLIPVSTISVLFVRQVQKDLLRGDKVGHSLAGQFGQRSGGSGTRRRDPVTYGVHYIGVLPAHQIQQDPLSGKKTVGSLAHPFRQQGHE